MVNIEEMVARIKKLKKEQKKTTKYISEISGVAIGTVNKILANETKDPAITSIIKIAEALNVSADYLVFGKEPENSGIESLTPDEKQLVRNYRELNEEGQEKLSDYSEDLTYNPRYQKNSSDEQDEEKTPSAI